MPRLKKQEIEDAIAEETPVSAAELLTFDFGREDLNALLRKVNEHETILKGE